MRVYIYEKIYMRVYNMIINYYKYTYLFIIFLECIDTNNFKLLLDTITRHSDIRELRFA